MNKGPDFVLPPSGYELTAFDTDGRQSATYAVYDASGMPFSLHVQTRASLEAAEPQEENLPEGEPSLPAEGATIDPAAIGDFIMTHADQILSLLVPQDQDGV